MDVLTLCSVCETFQRLGTTLEHSVWMSSGLQWALCGLQVCLSWREFGFFCGKLSREIFCEFRGFLAICESFLRKIWGQGIFWWHKRATRRSFLCENHFLPRKFPTVRLQIHHNCTPILCYDSLSCDNLVHFVRECIFLLAPLCSPSSFLFPLLLFVPLTWLLLALSLVNCNLISKEEGVVSVCEQMYCTSGSAASLHSLRRLRSLQWRLVKCMQLIEA